MEWNKNMNLREKLKQAQANGFTTGAPVQNSNPSLPIPSRIRKLRVVKRKRRRNSGAPAALTATPSAPNFAVPTTGPNLQKLACEFASKNGHQPGHSSGNQAFRELQKYARTY